MNLQEIENQIKQIPGNEPVLEKLYEILDSQEAIAIIGAGASAGLWPLWDELLTDFVDHSLKLGKITSDEADYFKNEAIHTPLETAQQLRKRIGDRDYFEYLHETFKDKISPQTCGAFTLTHKALLQLPIHNYLTLNYDAGLTNARATLYPKATTSYFFWDQEEARRIRERGYKRLVLHGHGRHDRADSIILTLNDYRKAYEHRPFVRLLNDIFNSEKLLFIGFGMTDPYIKQLFNNISKDSSKSPLRHIAFLGLNDTEINVLHLCREKVEMIYGARVLFYPTKNHHQALTNWLNMLVERYSSNAGSRTAEEVKLFPVPSQIKSAISDKYIHRPTDDENFKGRSRDFAILNRWANDPETRMIAITGIGGQGKTAMIGRWLTQERREKLSNIPVFYWSFYEDLDVAKFLERIVEFCMPIRPFIGEIEPISFILSVVQQVRLLLVLDGLEVLQEDVASPSHGKISHPHLNPFLQNWVKTKHKGLMILTSRFHFPQLVRYSGVGFHQLDLVRLGKEDGVALLQKINIYGDLNLLEAYVENLNGHPLALRVFASAVKRSCFGDITHCNSEEILFLDGEGKLSEKLDHLLSFYKSQLKDGQKELLGIISLFKRPVSTENFVILLGKMKSLKDTPLAKADAATIKQQLKLLIDDYLIEKTDQGITTHPVIRDYFRAGHKTTGTRREVADFLKARPGNERPENIEEVRDLVEAVQLLCDEGEFTAAHDLRFSRLDQGGEDFNIFRDLPAAAEGVECELAFVKNEERRKTMERIMGKSSLSVHYSGAGLNYYFLGDMVKALEWRKRSLEINRKLANKSNEATELFSISLIEFISGEIKQACDSVSQSLRILHEARDLKRLRIVFAFKAYYKFLLGYPIKAYKYFEFAICCDKSSDQKFLFSIMGNQHAEFLIRLKAWQKFDNVNSWHIQRSKINQSKRTLAFCHLLQGWAYICQEKLSYAEEALIQAEKILRSSGMMENTCRLDWVWALLAEAKQEYQKGLQYVNDALSICADKGFLLWQADHFVLRGRLFLLQFTKENQKDLDLVEKAGDDGNEALKIAEKTSYIWAKVDALNLLRSYHLTRTKLSQFNILEEKEAAQRYAKEVAVIKKGLFPTEKQIEEIKVKARKEFEKQTAGWG